MGERKSLCERIRNARANLANAEQSFQAKQDVRGELDLMLAELEMQNLRKRRSKRMLWTRQLLAAVCATLVLVGGYGGWLWASAKNTEVPAMAASRNTSAGVQDITAKVSHSPVKSLAKEEKLQKSAAVVPDKDAAGEAQKPMHTATIPASTAQPATAVVTQDSNNINLSTQQLQQLVRSGRQTLNSNK